MSDKKPPEDLSKPKSESDTIRPDDLNFLNVEKNEELLGHSGESDDLFSIILTGTFVAQKGGDSGGGGDGA